MKREHQPEIELLEIVLPTIPPSQQKQHFRCFLPVQWILNFPLPPSIDLINTINLINTIHVHGKLVGPQIIMDLVKRQIKVLDILFFTKSGNKICARERNMRYYILTHHWVGYRVKCWGTWEVLPKNCCATYQDFSQKGIERKWSA